MSKDRNNKKGFTLAEVLITLTIIGVVAALAIPSLLTNISDKTYYTKREGLKTRMAQAISQIGTLNAYEARKPNDYSGSLSDKEYAEKYSSMNFVTEGLSKVYKITNVCEFENFQACDFPSKINEWYSSNQTITETQLKRLNKFGNASLTAASLGGLFPLPVALRTKNGESMILFYNPRCVSDKPLEADNTKNIADELCIGIFYDLDGAKKEPSRWGKDVGYMAIFWPDTPYLVAPRQEYHNIDYGIYSYTDDPNDNANAEHRCSIVEREGYSAGAYTMLSREEMYAMVLLWWPSMNAYYWTTNIDGSGPDDYGWLVSRTLKAKYAPRNTSGGVVCFIKETSTK